MGLANDEARLVWFPQAETIENAHLTSVLHEYGFSEYRELRDHLERGPAELEDFYRRIIERLDLQWHRKPDSILNLSRGIPFANWFAGGQWNAAENALERWIDRGRGDQKALLWEDEGGNTREYTYKQLQREVKRCAAMLLELGIERGGTVGLWMPMVPEAAIALLAIGYIGAIAVPAFSGYGETALATRLQDAGATVLLAADTIVRRGKYQSTLATLRDVAVMVPSLEHIVLWVRVDPAHGSAQTAPAGDDGPAAPPGDGGTGVPGERLTFTGRRGKVFKDMPVPETDRADRENANIPIIDQFMLQAEEATIAGIARQMPRHVQIHGWHNASLRNFAVAQTLSPAIVAADEPYLLLYTSGSTGKPKGVVHSHTGFPLKVAIDQYLCFDVRPGDRMLWYTDMGWMMGPFLVLGALLLGATVVMYDGTPDFPEPDALWKIVARRRVTHLGVAPTVVRALATHGAEWPAKHDLSSLRILGSTGEPWNSTPYCWFLEHVGRGKAPIINYSGGTEIGGGILGCFPTMPLGPNAFHGPIPGMQADVVDAEGNAVRGGVGELVMRGPWPGMTQSLWGGSAEARDDERFLATYWQKLPGVWTHGDWAEVEIYTDETGARHEQWYIRGRSDDTINVAGKRVGPAEFESVLCAHDAVREAAAIAVPDAIKGDVVVCLTVLRDPYAADLDLIRAALFARLDHEIGHALRPKAIRFVDELPRTRNGKILRRIARARYLSLPDLGDLSGLENISALDAIDRAR